METRTDAVEQVCKACGSDDVKLDAWAVWDIDKQDWVLGYTFDDSFCESCEGETTIIDRQLTEETT